MRARVVGRQIGVELGLGRALSAASARGRLAAVADAALLTRPERRPTWP